MELKNILKYRSVWLGCAMLWIVFYHSAHFIKGLYFFKNIGYGGVDICLFASGAGCYYSLCKNDEPLTFLKRRFARIFPTYWCFLPFWFLYAFKAKEMNISTILGNIFGVQSIVGLSNAFNWYITTILLFYIFAPYFKKLVDKISDIKIHMLIICLMLVFSIPFWNTIVFIIIVSRIPIFYMGMLFAKYAKQGARVTKKSFVVYIVTMLLGFLLLYLVFNHYRDYRWTHGLYWYPFILVTPGLCVCISCAMTFLDRIKAASFVSKGLSFVGKYSFEIYLVHILVYDTVNYLIESSVLPSTDIVRILSTLFVPVGCMILSFITKLVFEKIPSMISR